MFKRAIILLFLLCLFISKNALAVKISIPHTSAYKGALVEVPVNLDHAEALGGFQMTVTYDFTALRVSDVTSGDLSPSSPWTIVRAIDTPGQIKIVAYDSSLGGPSKTNGSLIMILFLVTGGQGRDIDITIADTDIILSDIYGQPIPVSAANGFAAKGLLHVDVMDNDFDGVVDDVDKCPDLNNPAQTDTDGDGIGNECGERCQSTVYKPVKLNNNYYTSLQTAYDAAANGATIYLQSETLYQNLIATLNKSVTIDGGYNCAYSGYDSTVPYTTLKGEIVNESPSVLTLKNVFVSKYANTAVDCSNTSGLNLSDSDHDGTPDVCEACPPSTPSCDPNTLDTDHDGMPDSYEIQYGLNRSDPYDKDLDPDGDGLTNLQESQLGLHPVISDTDGDGLGDANDRCPTDPLNICDFWTDRSIQTGSTLIKAQHVIELRIKVNELRNRNGLAPYPWTNSTLTSGSSVIKAEDITDLRRAMNDVLTPDPTWVINPNLVRGTAVQGNHILELRNTVENAW